MEFHLSSQLSDRIGRWWSCFQEKAPALGRLFNAEEEWDLPEWMQRNLQAISPHLMWEFGPAANGAGHRLVITPEYRRDLRPLVARILDRAPGLDGWEFYAYRLPEDFEDALRTVEARAGGDISDVSFALRPTEFNTIDITFYSEGYRTAESLQAGRGDAFAAVEALLGEEVLDRWIGIIEAEFLGDRPQDLRPIRKLRPAVSARIAKIRWTHTRRSRPLDARDH